MSDINPVTLTSKTALENFNSDFSTSWEWGSNWTNVESQFETFVNKYLFPKLNETSIANVALGNRFEPYAKEIDFISQFSEEYVILDSVPVNMNLSKNAELMLKRNYPKMATKLYGPGVLRKMKFTLNNNDVRHNFNTLADATKYALAVYKKKISDINVLEEKEIKAMLVDYALNQTKDKREVASADELFTSVFEAILNIQNNSEKYNEGNLASGGHLGRYTTVSKLANVQILTTDKMKTFLLDTKLANTYQAQGLDLSDSLISFDDLGGTYRVLEDVEITSPDTIQLFRTFGDYQVEVGDIIPKDSILTFDVSDITETIQVEEIKPESDFFAYVYDKNKVRYRRNTKDMLKIPFYNPEFDEVTYWLHYYAFKNMSPFYNSVTIGG